MARLAIGVGGAIIASAVGLPPGVGLLAGTALGTVLFPPDPVVTRGPRLEDLKIQVSTLGRPIPRLHGTYQIAGNVIWSSGIKETTVTEKVGGKGLAGPSQKHVRYLYSASFAVGLCAGPIGGVLRIKADNKLIADYRASNTGPTVGNGTIRIYLGTESQRADPLIQAHKGVAESPAYRGLAYVVFEELQLADFGNRIPNITVEAFSEGSGAFPLVTTASFDSVLSSQEPVYRATDGLFYHAGIFNIEIYDPLSQSTVFTGQASDPLGIAAAGGGGGFGVRADGDVIYVKGNSSNVGRLNFIDANSMTVTKVIGRGSLFGGRHDIAGDFADPIVQRFHRTEIVGLGSAKKAELIALLASPDIGDTRKISVFNPDLTALSGTDARTAFFVGVAEKSVEGDGRDIGWPAIDDRLIVWCVTNSPSAVFVHEWEWDRSVNSLAVADAGGNVVPFEHSLTDISADIVAFAAGPAHIRCTWIEEQNALLFVLQNYAYLFDCASKTVIGPGLQVTSGTSGTNLNTTMRSGVGPDGKIIFKQNATSLNVLDTRTWRLEQDKYTTTDWGAVGSTGHGCGYVHELNAWLGVSKPNAQLLFLDRAQDGAKPLSVVVSDELLLSGLEPAEIEVSALGTDTVLGYVVGTQSRVRDNVEPLARVHAFDLVEIDGKLRAVRRGGPPAFAVPEDDLGAYDAGAGRPVSLLESRAAERALPWRIDLSYASRQAEYEAATQHDKRVDEATASRQAVTIATAEVLDDAAAKRVVRTLLAEAWEAAVEYETTLAQKWLRLDPSDRGTLSKGGTLRPVRVVAIDLGRDWVVRLRARRDGGALYGQTAVGTLIDFPDPPPLRRVGPSRMFLMDVPMLRDADDSFGLYAAGGPRQDDDAWPGALISDSDDGVDFAALVDITAGAAYGFSLGALADQPRWTVVDRASTLTVNWINGDVPATVSDQIFRDNGAVYLIGDEIVCVREVADNGDGSVTFSHMLRGRLGTEDRIGGHQPGERVLRLDAARIRRASTAIARLDAPRFFRISTLGQTTPQTEAEPFTNTGRSLRPYSPYHVRAVRQPNNDIIITWERRSRRRFPWHLNLRAPLAESAEEYALDLRHPLTEALLRSVPALTAQTYTYTRAEQLADGLGDGELGLPVTDITGNVTNPGAEAGSLAGWTEETSLWSASAAAAHSGTNSFRPQNDGQFLGVQTLRSDAVDLVAAGLDPAALDVFNQITFRCKYWRFHETGTGSTGDREQVGIRFLDAGLSLISEAKNALTVQSGSTGSWQQRELTGSAPAGTRYLQLVLYHDEQGTASANYNKKFLFDDITLEWAPTAPSGLVVDVFQISQTLKSQDGLGRGTARRKII